MFDDRWVWMYANPSGVERALHALLGLPEVVVELAEGYRDHGHPSLRTEERPGADAPTGPQRVDEECDRLGRLLEDGAAHLAAAKAAAAEQNRLAAVQARELAAFAALRPSDVLDRPDDEVGAAAAASRAAGPSALTDVSEWAVDEVMATLSLPSRSASTLLSESISLVERLPATLAALEAGVISWSHVRAMVDWVAGLDDAIRPGVEAALMAKAPGRTAAQLRECARRAVLRADASAAAKRLARALRDRSVRMYGERDGIASLTAMMSAPVTRACYRRLEALAEACSTPGDERTKDQRMADCLADLLIGCGSSGQSPVQVTLTVVAPAASLLGGDEPGEVDGMAVSALELREMAYALGLLPRPTRHHEAQATPEPDENAAAAPGERPRRIDPGEQAATDLAALLGIRTTAGTPLATLPTIAVVDEVSGALLAPDRRLRSAANRDLPPTSLPERSTAVHPSARRLRSRTTGRHRSLPPFRPAGQLRPGARPTLHVPRLPSPTDPLRPRPRRALPVRADVRREPLLPVPAPSPAQPPGAGLATAAPPPRGSRMDPPWRGAHGHPPDPVRHRRPRATRAGATADTGRRTRGSTTVLTGSALRGR